MIISMEPGTDDRLRKTVRSLLSTRTFRFFAYLLFGFLFVFPSVLDFETCIPASPRGACLHFIWSNELVRQEVLNGRFNLWRTDMLYYPYGVTLAQNASVPLIAALLIPVRVFLSPISAYNLAVLLSFPVLALAFGRYLEDKGIGRAPAMLAAGFFVFSPIRQYFLQKAELNLIALVWVPLFLLRWDRVLKNGHKRDGAWAAIWLLATAYTDPEAVPWLLIYAVLRLFFSWSLALNRDRFRCTVVAFGVFAAICLAGIAPAAIHVVSGSREYQSLPGKMTAARREAGANLAAYLLPIIDVEGVYEDAKWADYVSSGEPIPGITPPAEPLGGESPWVVGLSKIGVPLRAWMRSVVRLHHNAGNQSLYVGLSVLLLAGVGLLARRSRDVWAWTAAACLFGILSFGSRLRIGGWDGLNLPDIWGVFPLARNFRSPFRLGLMVSLFLCALAAVGIQRIGESRPRLLLLSPVILVLEFLWIPFPRVCVQVAEPIHAIRGGPPGAVATVPLTFGATHRYLAMLDMLEQTVHQRPILGGAPSRLPDDAERILKEYPVLRALTPRPRFAPPPSDAEILNALHTLESLGVRYVVVRRTLPWRWNAATEWFFDFADRAGIQPEFDSESVAVFRLPIAVDEMMDRGPSAE